MRQRLFAIFSLVAAMALHSNVVYAAGDQLEIGYLPILPMAQLFIGLESGSLQKKGAPAPKLVQFQNGPAITQALISGQLDAAYVGIGPAMIARAKGADIKVVASDIIEQVNVVALGPLASYFATGDRATAFARFQKDKGHKATIASYPKGAVPETVFQYWLRNKLKIDPAEINLIYQGEAQIQQALLSGAIDGAVILEPTVTVVLSKAPEARVVAHGAELFPNQPGAVLLVREKLIREQPGIVQQLLVSHVAATKLLRNNPARSADYVQKYVGGGRMDRALVEKAIRNSHDQFIADPSAIISGTKNLQQFQNQLGTLGTESVNVEQLFDTRFYDKVAK